HVGAAGERIDQLRVVAVQKDAVPRVQARLAALHEGEDAFTVQLSFEDPAGIREVVLGERREHRIDPFRLLRPHAAISSTVFPDKTDSGRAVTISVFRSAYWSSILTRSQFSSSPRRPRVSANPPISLWPTRAKEMWPVRRPSSMVLSPSGA